MINFLWILVTPLFGGKKVVFHFSIRINEALGFIKGLVEKGKFSPVIDMKYPFEKIAEAYIYVASGQKIGNVIITMDA
jgi:NADPH:quinone reductase-like Zn-dependent oxidoreductase